VTAKRKEGAPDGGGNDSRGGGDKRQGGMAAALLSLHNCGCGHPGRRLGGRGGGGRGGDVCSGCSVFDFVFSALRTWDSMRKQ
jgi:hypothetical protein